MNAPKIYNYHPKSFEYLGQSVADRSPMEDGVWLFPAFSTLQPPPALEPKKSAIFSTEQGKWQLIDDYRGETWFKADGTSVEIVTLGNPVHRGLMRELPLNDDKHMNSEMIYPVLTARQIRLLLRKLDKLPLVQGLINAMPSPKKEDAQIEWDYGTHFDHQHFLVQYIVSGLEIDPASFNQAWIEFSRM